VGGGSLAGVRVLELGLAIAAPHCCQILADHGADVLKVEPPGGDKTRWALPHKDGESLYFAAHNRGKRSAIIDLKSDPGRQIFLRLVETADVVVTNYGADVPERLGIGYGELASKNPAVVMVHITGFGFTGPYRSFGAYDGIIQAMSGVASLTGTAESGPTVVGPFVADHMAAAQAVIGVLLALHERQRTGAGCFVDISMLDGYLGVLAHHVGEALDMELDPQPPGNRVPIAFAGTFEARDGLVYLAPLAPDAWKAFCRAIEAPEWVLTVDRHWVLGEGRGLVEEVVTDWCRSRTRTEIVELLRAVGVPCGPVNRVGEAVSDPYLWVRGSLTRVQGPAGFEVSVPGPAVPVGLVTGDRARRVPLAGEHTRSVLTELGYRGEELDQLYSAGVVADASTPVRS
jgi:CoA:oxalate CoA-transferase